MAKYYYNGVLLPEIPADVLAEYPYAWIRANSDTKYYDLIFSTRKWYFATAMYSTASSSEEFPWYRVEMDNAHNVDEWTFYEATTGTFGISETRPVHWANHDIPKDTASSTTIYFFGSDPVPEETDEPEKPETVTQYLIRSDTLTAIADAIRIKKETTAVFTPEQMAVEIADIVSGDDLPNAEEAYFGTGDGSNGERLIEWTEDNGCNQWGEGTIGWEFTVNETFGVVGFKGMVTEAGTYTFKIREQYEESAVAELQVNFEETYTWCEFKLSSTVNLLAGKTYAFTLYGNKMPYVGTLTSYTMNSKVTEINKVYISGTDAYPTETTKSRPTINMLMGSAITESTPNEYKIQTQTLSDIADEVRRIGGVSGNITMAQMLTTLQSIQLQDKSVTPTAEVQTITPDDGYYGLSSVTVGAITEENEAVIEIINEKMEVVANDTY